MALCMTSPSESISVSCSNSKSATLLGICLTLCGLWKPSEAGSPSEVPPLEDGPSSEVGSPSKVLPLEVRPHSDPESPSEVPPLEVRPPSEVESPSDSKLSSKPNSLSESGSSSDLDYPLESKSPSEAESPLVAELNSSVDTALKLD